MFKRIRRIATSGFWFNFKQLLIQKDMPQALFSVGITTLCFLLASVVLQRIYTLKIATQPIIIASLIAFTALILAIIAFLVFKASCKFHIAFSEKLDKIIEFSYAMKNIGIFELDEQIAFISKKKIYLYISKLPIINIYLEDANVKRYTLLQVKEKIKYYKGEDRLCINAATYEQLIQEREKAISSLESAAIAKKEEEIKVLKETILSTLANTEKLEKENVTLRNTCKTQPAREKAIEKNAIRQATFWRVAGPLLNTLCEHGDPTKPYTRPDIQAAFDTAIEDYADLKDEIRHILLASRRDTPSKSKSNKPVSEFDLGGWAMEALREGLGNMAERKSGAPKKH